MATINKKKQKVNSILEILRANGVSDEQIEAISPGLEETVEDSVTSEDLQSLQDALLTQIQQNTEATNKRLAAVEKEEKAIEKLEKKIEGQVSALDKKVQSQAEEFKKANDRADEEAKKNLAARHELKKQLDERNEADDKVAELAAVVEGISAENGPFDQLTSKIGELESNFKAQEQAIKDQGEAHQQALADTLSAIDERLEAPEAALVEIKTQLEGLPESIATLVESQVSSIVETKIREVMEEKFGDYIETLSNISETLMNAGAGFIDILDNQVPAAIEEMKKGSEEASRVMKSTVDQAKKAKDSIVEIMQPINEAFEDLENARSDMRTTVTELQKEKREIVTIANRKAEETHGKLSVRIENMVKDFMDKHEESANQLSDAHEERLSQVVSRETKAYRDIATLLGQNQELFNQFSTLVAGVDVDRIEALRTDIAAWMDNQKGAGFKDSISREELSELKKQLEKLIEIVLANNGDDLTNGGNKS